MHTNPLTRPPALQRALRLSLHQPCALSAVSTSDAAASAMMRPQRFHHPPTASVHSCMPCNAPALLSTLMQHLHLHRTSWSVTLFDTVPSPSHEDIPAELCCIANDQRYTGKHPPEFLPSMVKFFSNNH
ncbi:hypothetical protein M405DRAFT_11437 [Rhizopogon salebrosus TDB-379]|nr:hypothetical protein M405DRAFT_11437 [Rhizopogon salebrosus TDB-379]